MKKLPIILLSLIPITLSANEINDQALKACSLIENDFQRLLCYDQVIAGKEITKRNVQQTTKSTATTASNTNNTGSVAPSQSSANDNFGLEHKQIGKDGDEITAKVTRVKKRQHGELIIYLDNGHVWHQVGNERFSVKAGENVIISRGMLNSFTLKVEGRNQGIKVKRK